MVLALGPARIRGVVPFLVAVSAGALLGDAFLHLLPEATEHHGGFGGTVAWCTLGGVLFFFLVESVIHWHHHGDDIEAHEHEHEHDGDDAHEHDEDGHEHDEPEHEEDGHDHEDDDDPEDGNHDEHDE